VIAPHGDLHLLPWGGLFYKSKRLFEYCPVGVVPNLHCIELLNGAFSKAPSILAIGDPDYGRTRIRPLPNAARELESVVAPYTTVSSRVKAVLIGKRATEKTLTAFVRKEDLTGTILHVCCHGTVEPDEPLNSGLLLTRSRLDASEIAMMRLPLDEVVLSACSTGWRPQSVGGIKLEGDDILGLPGAFLEAGVKAVLVSIPPAADGAAKDFMVRYHRGRAKGLTPLTALRETQLGMLNDAHFGGRCHEWIGFTAYATQ
jgi:CHAT domain-containing protein